MGMFISEKTALVLAAAALGRRVNRDELKNGNGLWVGADNNQCELYWSHLSEQWRLCAPCYDTQEQAEAALHHALLQAHS